MILLNTCHIREKAAEKVYSELGRLQAGSRRRTPTSRSAWRAAWPRPKAKRSCAASRWSIWWSARKAITACRSWRRARATGKRALDTDFPDEDKFETLRHRPKAARGPTAFLTVQEGCDKFCAFCVVPYTRGAEVSRPADRILEEARDLVERGVREITLLGQNVNAYHGSGEGGDWSLARLIRALDEIDGLERIRFTTSHPNDMSDDLIAAHGDCAKLMPYLHLPVQSGCDRILKRMNRNHTAEAYLRLIERIRAARPDILLSGDFIVGFPEETEADFEATLDLIRAVEYG